LFSAGASYHLVRLVGTVEVAVTTPFQRDAVVVFHARELGDRTRDVRTVQLVRAVLTVVVLVAHPDLLYALAVAARELVVSARFVCGGARERKNGISVGHARGRVTTYNVCVCGGKKRSARQQAKNNNRFDRHRKNKKNTNFTTSVVYDYEYVRVCVYVSVRALYYTLLRFSTLASSFRAKSRGSEQTLFYIL